jgi:ribonuclease D
MELIDTKESLDKFIQEIASEKELAIDLECENNLHYYGTYMCLMQVGSRDKVWILDPLKISLAPIKNILEDRNTLKVFHDIDFDFRILNSELGIKPKYFFDTKMAAEFLGKTNIGLTELLESVGVHSTLNQQKADWTRRPLNNKLLAYAAQDVSDLLSVKDFLQEELERVGRMTWFRQEMDWLENKEHKVIAPSFETMSGIRLLTPKQIAIIHALYDKRETVARELNCPVHYVLTNKQLLSIAKDPRTDPGFWKNIRTHPIVRQYSSDWGAVVSSALRRKETLQKIIHPPIGKFKRLQEMRKELAKQLGVSSNIVLSKDDMESLAYGKTDHLREWQRALFGNTIDRYK